MVRWQEGLSDTGKPLHIDGSTSRQLPKPLASFKKYFFENFLPKTRFCSKMRPPVKIAHSYSVLFRDFSRFWGASATRNAHVCLAGMCDTLTNHLQSIAGVLARSNDTQTEKIMKSHFLSSGAPPRRTPILQWTVPRRTFRARFDDYTVQTLTFFVLRVRG